MNIETIVVGALDTNCYLITEGAAAVLIDPGDRDAADKNGVHYYPILVRHEGESWAELAANGLAHLKEGSYGGSYEKERIDAFLKNLGG